MILNTFNQNPNSVETTLDELEYLKSELTSDYPVSKARLNYISHQLFKMESANKNFKLREESFTGDLQADLVVRCEDMIAAGIATLIAMLIAYFSSSGSSSGGGGGGSSALSGEEIKKKAEVKAKVDVNKILRGAITKKEISVTFTTDLGWRQEPNSFSDIIFIYSGFYIKLSSLFKKLQEVFSNFKNKTIEDFLKDKDKVETPVVGNVAFYENDFDISNKPNLKNKNVLMTPLSINADGHYKEARCHFYCFDQVESFDNFRFVVLNPYKQKTIYKTADITFPVGSDTRELKKTALNLSTFDDLLKSYDELKTTVSDRVGVLKNLHSGLNTFAKGKLTKDENLYIENKIKNLSLALNCMKTLTGVVSSELAKINLSGQVLTTLEKELPGFTKELNEDAEALKKALEEEAKANST